MCILTARGYTLMQVEQLVFNGNDFDRNPALAETADWVLIFGDRALIEREDVMKRIRASYPSGYLMGCSTAGEICSGKVNCGTLCITAVRFERSKSPFFTKFLMEKKPILTLSVGNWQIRSIPKVSSMYFFLRRSASYQSGPSASRDRQCTPE